MKYTLQKLEHAEIAQEAMTIIKSIEKKGNIESVSVNHVGDVTILFGWINDTINLSFLSDLSSSYTDGGNKMDMLCTQKHTSISFFKCLPSKNTLIISIPTKDNDSNSILL